MNKEQSIAYFSTEIGVDLEIPTYCGGLGVLGNRPVFDMKNVFCCEGVLNVTFLALNLSHYVNGVAKKHGEVTQREYENVKIGMRSP